MNFEQKKNRKSQNRINFEYMPIQLQNFAQGKNNKKNNELDQKDTL